MIDLASFPRLYSDEASTLLIEWQRIIRVTITCECCCNILHEDSLLGSHRPQRLMLRVSALFGGTAHQLALPANTQLASEGR